MGNLETSHIIIGIVILLIIFFILLYNSLIRKKNNCEQSWSGIAIQLKRRYNLIPNLINTVQGYAKHEKETLEKITKARTAAMSAKSMKDHEKAENMLSSTLKSLFALSENYPDLKANENFLHLQEELSDTEDKIQASRKFYNNTVKNYNTAIQSIPTNIVAKICSFKEKEFFELEKPEEAQPVETKF